MIKNKIYKITSSEISQIKKEMIHDPSLFLVEMDGEKIHTWEEYIVQIERKFEFPTTCIDSMDRYLDWIRDLDWIEKDSFVIVIYNYNDFFSSELELKNKIINGFKDTILPFWEEEVERVVVEGKAKSFKVYLVE
ncbi:barstar family protein [Rossellomorea sp. GAMAL-10_SWC]